MGYGKLPIFDAAGDVRRSEQWALYNFLARDALGHVCVKIGISSLVYERALMLRTGCPFEMDLTRFDLVGTRRVAALLERALQASLADYRTSGEWFRFKLGDPVHSDAFKRRTVDAFIAVIKRRPAWRKISVEQLQAWATEVKAKRARVC